MAKGLHINKLGASLSWKFKNIQVENSQDMSDMCFGNFGMMCECPLPRCSSMFKHFEMLCLPRQLGPETCGAEVVMMMIIIILYC